MTRRFISNALIMLITLVLCETVLRVSNPDYVRPFVGAGHHVVEIGPFLPHPTRFWCLAPSNTQTEANARGFRGPEISIRKPANGYRIFCLGNSCTFGVGCSYRHAFPARLQEMLESRFGEGRVEVVNAGVPGYSSLQMWRYLREDIFRYDPDMVIVQYGENDEDGANNRNQYPSRVVFYLRPLLQKSKLFQAGYALYYGIRRLFHDYFETYRTNVRRQSYRDCLDNLMEIQSCVLEKGRDVFFMTPAWLVEGRLRSIVSFTKHPRIDIFTVLNESGLAPSSLYIDVHHWLPAGHRLVASAVYDAIYPTVLAHMGSNSN